MPPVKVEDKIPDYTLRNDKKHSKSLLRGCAFLLTLIFGAHLHLQSRFKFFKYSVFEAACRKLNSWLQ